ncbi:MAG: tetratricopeptide repeat protein [Acidobacteria bacterium]|nr:tetratricopeptide repeat protein [Acidobacteriota bacterium]
MIKIPRLMMAALLLFLAAGSSAGVMAGDRYVVLPFTNQTREDSLYWMGEAMAIGLTDHLLAAGVAGVSPQRRRDGLVEIGLDSREPVTLASAILLARRLGADRIVVGQYALLADHGLSIRGHTVSAQGLEQGEPVEVRGALADLHRLQQKFVHDLVPRSQRQPAKHRITPMQEMSTVPLSSVELYTRAMLVEDPEQRRNLLTRALEADPVYAAALIQRALVEIAAGRPESSFLWLDRVSLEKVAFPERYWLARGDACAANGDRGSAIDNYEKALALRSTATAHFRLGAVLAQGGRLHDARLHISEGLTLDPHDPEGLELHEALAVPVEAGS